MSSSTCLRAVYKQAGDCDIDTEIWLPKCQDHGQARKHPIIINIHGGAFVLGSSKMVNRDQIEDCLNRGWIVVVPNHRLCPGINMLDGPIQDCRDLLAWIYDGGLANAITTESSMSSDLEYDSVFAFGTSSGGHLALCLGFGVSRPVAGILDFYGACNFADAFWESHIPSLEAILPKDLEAEFLNQVYAEHPIPIEGGVSLEGQRRGGPDFTDPRQAFAMTHIAKGTLMPTIQPSKEWDTVDPARNITSRFPPTCIVHGLDDKMVPMHLSEGLLSALQSRGVRCKMIRIPEEGHTFAAQMKVGSRTWETQREGFDFLESLLTEVTKGQEST